MGFIYKIVCKKTEKVYFGSTKNPLKQRLKEHESHYRRYQKGKIYYQSSIDILKEGDYGIHQLEVCDNDKLKIRERYYIDNYDCVNIKTPGKTAKEWREDNKEKVKGYQYKYGGKYYGKQGRSHKVLSQYRKYWGGDFRSAECNLLKISPDLFH